jgi:predicted DNA-binding transcriptional regulator AlpA
MNNAGNTLALVNETEAARILGLSVKTLRRWRWAGKPPRFLKIGAAVRYDPADLAAFIEAARRTSTTDTGATS